jgi:malonyl CoA-acyl carrier protein transacylase
MAAAAALGRPHGMLSVVGLLDSQLQDICQEVRANQGAGTVCEVANYLFPQVTTVFVASHQCNVRLHAIGASKQ